MDVEEYEIAIFVQINQVNTQYMALIGNHIKHHLTQSSVNWKDEMKYIFVNKLYNEFFTVSKTVTSTRGAADGRTRENQRYKQFFPFSHRIITNFNSYIHVLTDFAPYPIAS